MKRIALGLAALALLANVSRAAEVMPPKPANYFNDYAGVVSRDAARHFNEQLAQFERDTSDQVVVAVFPKMQSESSIEDYTQRVAQNWGVGQKDRRNGVLLFVFIQDRKMFIQVGYGLEGALPDATAFEITEYNIKPQFVAGDYEGGLRIGIDSICKAIRGEYTGKTETVREQHRSHRTIVPLFLFALFFLLSLLAGIHRTARAGYGYSSRRSGWNMDWGNVFSFMLGVLLSGGSSSGGDRSSSGGGFSGGGGSFGGGGAGSSW